MRRKECYQKGKRFPIPIFPERVFGVPRNAGNTAFKCRAQIGTLDESQIPAAVSSDIRKRPVDKSSVPEVLH